MDYPLYTVTPGTHVPLLCEIPSPPKTLFARGALPPPGMVLLSVVGSRHYSNYGKQVVEYLIHGLAGYPIGIVSGLAIGIDALAHTAALETHLYTLGVPGSGLDDTVLYPRTNRNLARKILDQGGGLLSEFEPDFRATPWSFPQRNRIMAGFSHATLVIEASEKSGTLITARLAADYNRELFVVPGNIFSENSIGPHQFLKLGATPVTGPNDIIDALHLEKHDAEKNSSHAFSENEKKILEALSLPRDHNAIIELLTMDAQLVNILLMELELKGAIREMQGVFYRTQ